MTASAPLPLQDFPLLRRDEGGITILTLSAVKSRNSLSEAMMDALQRELDDIRDDPAVRVVVIAAEGPVFSAGHDLKELTARRADADGGRAYFAKIMDRCARLMTSIVRLPQPVIAEVAGLATAAGCQLVASCDLVVAAEEARFCTPGVNIGLFCSTPMVALSRAVSRKHAMEMLLTGEIIGAARAHEMGLVNRVVPFAALHATAMELARTLAAKSAKTLRIGKEAFYRQAEMNLDAAYAHTAAVMVENMMTADAEEGICAFLDKRPPEWRDR